MIRFHLSSVGFAKVWKKQNATHQVSKRWEQEKNKRPLFQKKCFENEILSNPLNHWTFWNCPGLDAKRLDSAHTRLLAQKRALQSRRQGATLVRVATASPQNRKSKHQMMSNGQIWWLTCSHTFLTYHKSTHPQFSIFARLALWCFHGSLSTSGPSKSRTTSPTSSFLRTYIALRVSSVVY